MARSSLTKQALGGVLVVLQWVMLVVLVAVVLTRPSTAMPISGGGPPAPAAAFAQQGPQALAAESNGRCFIRAWAEKCPGSDTKYRSCMLTPKCQITCTACADTGADDPYDFSAGAPTAGDGGSRQRRAFGANTNNAPGMAFAHAPGALAADNAAAFTEQGPQAFFTQSNGVCVTRNWTEKCPGSDTKYRSCRLTIKCKITCSLCADTGADDPYDFSAGAPTASDGGSRQRRVDANGNIPKRSDSTFHDTGTQAQEQARKDAALYKWFKGLGWV